ncbi:hypothetical protein P9869_38690 [Streptomyces ossamyceticus]|nr:hypothetical protein [Streptomyces ossamyceticus]
MPGSPAKAGPAPTHRSFVIPAVGPTPPPITVYDAPRLATALFRHYLRACIVRSPDAAHPLSGGRPEAALDESRRLGHHT